MLVEKRYFDYSNYFKVIPTSSFCCVFTSLHHIIPPHHSITSLHHITPSHHFITSLQTITPQHHHINPSHHSTTSLHHITPPHHSISTPVDHRQLIKSIWQQHRSSYFIKETVSL
ncbi:histidine-rich protein PFHRP-II [Biomphalaria glabrata]|nr:histidine-rich protein PFHRP-II [Biomphalaria glabrata]